jgi:rhodanese-related sulfurtransferase
MIDRMTPTSVTASQAKTWLDRGQRLVFVDARNPAAWGSSTVKLPGAVRVPAGEVEEHLDELPQGSRIITYCT